ncbi:MAG TPA: glycosyltransferase [Ohtaekwangia sp.]|uniref:glycosyltransferase family 2 protein n=1 Tax=Ohtaekwangia sp. TaxID=2066019 RepID=UPI002F925F9A
MSPFISVVVPTYRRPALLIKCLDALINQSYPANRYEIIVVSDGPDPETFDAVNTFRTDKLVTIHILALPEKRGPAAARNLGWRSSQAALIVFTDDDCLPHPQWIRAFSDVYRITGKRMMAMTGRTIVPRSNPPTDYEQNIANLERAEFITANCAITRNALQTINGLDEAFTMAWREDSDLQFKLMKRGIRIYPVVNACVTHPVRKVSWGRCLKEEKKGMFDALLLKKHPEFCRMKINVRPPWHYYAMILFFVLAWSGLISQNIPMLYFSCCVWLAMVMLFAWKRLQNTAHTPAHIAEMIFTSAWIPFLSVYWHLYGSIRFRSFCV